MNLTSPASIDSILDDRLYLGNLAAALSLDRLNELGITHILSVCPEYPSKHDRTHLSLPVQDSEYEDLLIHLPTTCRFIQSALDQGGKVLVHCLMGVSRSPTVVCAYLMWSRKLSAMKAVAFTKKRRPQVHPNYGFMKQLEAFATCDYNPSPNNGAYRTWKRRRMQDITHFFNAVSDTTAIVPDKLYMSNEFPDDPQEVEALLRDLGMTHIISVSPAQVQLPSTIVNSITHRHFNIPTYKPDTLLLALPQICQFIKKAIGGGGQVLVHCVIESRACIVACAYLMYSRTISPTEAVTVIEEALPLFNPTAIFHKQLELFDLCKYNPVPSHPLVAGWVAEVSKCSGSKPSPPFPPSSTSPATFSTTQGRFLSSTMHDLVAFNEALKPVETTISS